MSIPYIVNAMALGISSLAALMLVAGTLRWHDRTTGGRMMLLTIISIAGWLILSFFELFIRNQAFSFSITVFGTTMVVGMLLVAMSVPNKRFTWLHWLVLATAVPLNIAVAIPGIVYKDIVPTGDGYSDLLTGDYFLYHQGIVVAYLFIAMFVYGYRLYRDCLGAECVLLRVLAIGHAMFILVSVSTVVILPAFGYSQFSNIGTAFVLVFVMSAITYAYGHYYTEHTDKKLSTTQGR